MGTQAVVSVLNSSGKVLAKAVAGRNGDRAVELAAEIRRRRLTDPRSIYKAALRVGFGDEGTLVVQGPRGNVHKTDETLSDLYIDRKRFQDPRFNPRWQNGTADNVELVQIGTNNAREHRRAREVK